jgi:hypothetical protein
MTEKLIFRLFQLGYPQTLSVSKLRNLGKRIVDEYVTVDGIKIVRGSWIIPMRVSSNINPIWFGLESKSGPLWWQDCS